jgi:DMSO/TMAO reductase YedYZ molybdopterin-dependent catalytic subunit
MNGEVLPREHGYPARLIVPGLYGYVSATKWLSEIELTEWDAFDAYWVERTWAKEAPIKTQSRIDVPRSGQSVPAGQTMLAGVAWAR